MEEEDGDGGNIEKMILSGKVTFEKKACHTLLCVTYSYT